MNTIQSLFLHAYSLKEKEIEKLYPFLGEGISRQVFALNEEYVLKLAKGKDGLHQNRVEHHVYSTVNSHFKKYLCPIVCYQPNLLIMKRAEPLSSTIKSDFISLNSLFPTENAFKDLNYLANKYHLFYEDIISTSSWGIINDIPTLIDYGCTTAFGDLYYELLFMCS